MSEPTTVGPASPTLLFARLRWRVLRNNLRQALGGSLLRPLMIFLASLLVWMFVFGVSYEGFHYLRRQQFNLGGSVIERLFDLLFLTLGVLLVFSTALILYGSLFASAETSFLLAAPAPDDHIFAYKYAGALAFSSWAFLILGVPILLAFGLTAGAPWHFYVLLPAYFLGFILLPGAAGALACLLVVNFLPRRKKHLMILGGLLAVAPVVWLVVRSLPALNTDTLNRDTIQDMLSPFEAVQSPLMPTHWPASGLRASARGDGATAGYYLGLTWANGLFAFVVVAWVARKLYRRGVNRVATGGDLQRRPGGHWLDRLLERMLFFLSPQMRLLIVKDFRTFRRDPAQWAQVLIFTALLSLYFLNIKKLFVRDMTWQYQNALSLLNLTATALLLCTYTGRFIYPMLSLEGRKFWILGLLPLRREKLLWGKFAFATTGGLMISLGLVVVSDVMLEMPALLVVIHALTVAALAAGLSGLSVGLGACMPSFRETDPSKIAAGFGGTMNLLAGLGYLVVVIGLMAGPWHALAAADDAEVAGVLSLVLVGLGVAVGLFAAAAAVVIPLWCGARRLRAMEF